MVKRSTPQRRSRVVVNVKLHWAFGAALVIAIAVTAKFFG